MPRIFLQSEDSDDDVEDDDGVSNCEDEDNKTLSQRAIELLYDQNKEKLDGPLKNVLHELLPDQSISVQEVANKMKINHLSHLSNENVVDLLIVFAYDNPLPVKTVSFSKVHLTYKKHSLPPGFQLGRHDTYDMKEGVRRVIEEKEVIVRYEEALTASKRPLDNFENVQDKKTRIEDPLLTCGNREDLYRNICKTIEALKIRRPETPCIVGMFLVCIRVRKLDTEKVDFHLTPTWDKGVEHMRVMYRQKYKTTKPNIQSFTALKLFLDTY